MSKASGLFSKSVAADLVLILSELTATAKLHKPPEEE